MASKKSVNEHFYIVSERIKKEINLKTDTELFSLLEIPQSTYSRRKSEKFPAEWAYELELKTGLSTRWIMTGEGPKRLNAARTTTPFLAELETWAREISKDGSLDWLEQQLAVCLPTWQMWREKKKAEKAPAETDQVA